MLESIGLVFSFSENFERNFMSIFIISKVKSFRTFKPEYPEPKSSNQREKPFSLKEFIAVCSLLSVSVRALSVIST